MALNLLPFLPQKSNVYAKDLVSVKASNSNHNLFRNLMVSIILLTMPKTQQKLLRYSTDPGIEYG